MAEVLNDLISVPETKIVSREDYVILNIAKEIKQMRLEDLCSFIGDIIPIVNEVFPQALTLNDIIAAITNKINTITAREIAYDGDLHMEYGNVNAIISYLLDAVGKYESGGVESASKLSTPRNISIDGVTKGSAVFDGSTDITINTSGVAYLGDDTGKLYFEDNALNFGGASSSSTIYIGEQSKDSRPIPSSYDFGSAEIHASNYFKGNTNLDDVYSPITHNHDNVYSKLGHTHNVEDITALELDKLNIDSSDTVVSVDTLPVFSASALKLELKESSAIGLGSDNYYTVGIIQGDSGDSARVKAYELAFGTVDGMPTIKLREGDINGSWSDQWVELYHTGNFDDTKYVGVYGSAVVVNDSNVPKTITIPREEASS